MQVRCRRLQRISLQNIEEKSAACLSYPFLLCARPVNSPTFWPETVLNMEDTILLHTRASHHTSHRCSARGMQEGRERKKQPCRPADTVARQKTRPVRPQAEGHAWPYLDEALLLVVVDVNEPAASSGPPQGDRCSRRCTPGSGCPVGVKPAEPADRRLENSSMPPGTARCRGAS